MSLNHNLPVVFTAQSKAYFYCRDAVCAYVFSKGAVPVNPFRVFEYFLGDRVDRDLVRQGNNNLIRIADQFWVFGTTLADGVIAEILLARELQKPTRYFTIDNRVESIREIFENDLAKELRFETELYAGRKFTREELLDKVLGRDPNQPTQLSLLDVAK